MKKLSIGIGAIFRDEFPYVLEWLVWHQLAGFDQFYVADNASSDGTTELLEALQELGYVNVLYQPVVEKQAQLIAYERIVAAAVGSCDALMFIDADEFVTHSSHKTGAEVKYLRELLKQPDVGAISLNWRVFGSSGHRKFTDAPVTERFTQCASDNPGNKNGHLKSVTLTRFVKSVGPHHSRLSSPLRWVDGNGNDLSDFIVIENGRAEPAQRGGIIGHVVDSPVRVNHYAVKSFEEYSEKKRRRGSSMRGVDYDKGAGYFQAHDLNECDWAVPPQRMTRLKAGISKLRKALANSVFCAELTGSVDISNRHGIRGWVVCRKGSVETLRLQVFVNGRFCGSADTGFYRGDLIKAKISSDGLGGFRWQHPQPLQQGDIVEVRVYGNRFVFPKRARVVID